MTAEPVHGSITGLALAAVRTDGVSEKAIIARAQLHDGTKFILHWELLSDDARRAAAFFAGYADALDRSTDAELAKLCGED